MISEKETYLYILRGETDVFGYTSNIQHNPNGTYVYWYKITGSSGLFLESIIKRKIHGLSCEDIRKVIVNMLKELSIVYEEYDTDTFKLPESSYTSVEVLKYKDIFEVKNKIDNNKKLLSGEILFIKNQKWIYKHIENPFRLCQMCKNKEKQKFNIYNERFEITILICTLCIKEIKLSEFHDKKVEDKLESMGFSKTIIKDSSINIKNIIHDSSEYIYSYLLSDITPSQTEVSNVYITENILTNIFNSVEKYDPRYTLCMIVVYMYRNSYTYISRNNISNIIDEWNRKYETYWNIDVATKYLINKEHSELVYDNINNIFIFSKYYEMEKKFVGLWKILDITDNTNDNLINSVSFMKEQYSKFIKDSRDNLDTETLKNYTEKQSYIFDMIANNKISILSGVAGSGKSTISSYICKSLSTEYNIIQMAPTGKAVSVIKQKNHELEFIQENTCTIHSFICNENVRDCMLSSTKKNLLIHLDESSMIDLSLIIKILEKIEELERVNKYSVKILISGDHDQLPPIGFGSPFRYITENLKKTSPNLLKLTKNMRNECSLAEWMTYTFYKEKCCSISDFMKFANNKSEKWQNKREITKKIKKFNLLDITKLKYDNYQFMTYNNSICDAINYYFKNGTKINTNTEYCNNMKMTTDGDKIMILKNGYDSDNKSLYYNGEEGIINNIYKNSKGRIASFDLQKPNSTKHIKFTSDHMMTYHINQLISYSWCKTIHKTQGDGFNNVCLILDGQTIDKTSLNTALTRTKKDIVVMYADKWYTKILNKNIINNNSFIPTLYKDIPLVLEQEDNNQLKAQLIDLLPKYKYDMKYMIEHDIEISNRDLLYLKSKLNKWWSLKDYNKFINKLNEL
jgi:hypothetical protein